MKCPYETAPLGFDLMVYRDPCEEMKNIPASTQIDETASVDTAIRTDVARNVSTVARTGWPWWILVVLGYLYYKEQQGV